MYGLHDRPHLHFQSREERVSKSLREIASKTGQCLHIFAVPGSGGTVPKPQNTKLVACIRVGRRLHSRGQPKSFERWGRSPAPFRDRRDSAASVQHKTRHGSEGLFPTAACVPRKTPTDRRADWQGTGQPKAIRAWLRAPVFSALSKKNMMALHFHLRPFYDQSWETTNITLMIATGERVGRQAGNRANVSNIGPET
jgi:hypothetical protein